MSEPVTISVTLTHGIPFKDRKLKKVVIREPLLDDLIEAETEANSVFAPIAHRRALAARQVVSLDGEVIPVTPPIRWAGTNSPSC